MSVDDRLQATLTELVTMRAARRGETHSLKDGGGDGTSGGVTDDWKAHVDGHLATLHSDVRALLYGLIGGFLFLIAGGAAAYISLAGQIADGRKDVAGQILDGRKDVSALQVEQAKINGKLDLIIERTAPPTTSSRR